MDQVFSFRATAAKPLCGAIACFAPKAKPGSAKTPWN